MVHRPSLASELRLGEPATKRHPFLYPNACDSKGCRAEARRAEAGLSIVNGFSYVYILQSEIDPERFYVGLTDNLAKRLGKHNVGGVRHTATRLLQPVRSEWLLFANEARFEGPDGRGTRGGHEGPEGVKGPEGVMAKDPRGS